MPSPLILCARVSWPVPAVRGLTEQGGFLPLARDAARVPSCSVSPWRCSWCGARVKVVA